jgi:hypothetical protein
MDEPAVPLRDLLEQRLTELEKLREEDREFYLVQMREMAAWREAVNEKVTSLQTRMLVINAGVAMFFTILIAIIQIWRGAP